MSEGNPKSFWTSAPGILTGIATLITATAGLLGVLYQIGAIGGETKEQPDRPDSHNSQPRRPPGPGANPPPGTLRIVEMMLRADPFDYSGPCPVTITFSGRISVAGGRGRVSYKFLRSDGASAPVQTLEFSSPGSKQVTTTWRLGGAGQSYSGWQAIKTFDPEEKESDRAAFRIHCS